MKDVIDRLLAQSEGRRVELVKERELIQGLIDTAIADRKTQARIFVNRLVPDVDRKTINTIRRMLPRFKFPMVTTWVFFKKIDAGMTAFDLRILVGSYLDTMDRAPLSYVQFMTPFDDKIEDLQANWAKTVKALNAVDQQVAALQKLKAMDTEKLDTRYRQRLERALRAQADNPQLAPVAPKNVRGVGFPYPRQADLNSDSGSNLLVMWLWYELISNHDSASATLSAEPAVHAVHSPVADASAVAGGALNDTPHPAGSMSSADTSASPHSHHAGSDHIDHHMAAGAQNFS
jgi:hypothetical protein